MTEGTFELICTVLADLIAVQQELTDAVGDLQAMLLSPGKPGLLAEARQARAQARRLAARTDELREEIARTALGGGSR